VGCYLQFEITPFDVMYESLIINPYMNGTNMTHELVNCSTSGVLHKVAASNATHTWQAELALPWSLLGDTGNGQGFAAPPNTALWRLNLFRVVMLEATDFCTPENCAYGALSPTLINPPAFHYPAYFAVAVLE
jgi:hypothetical protein